MSARREKFVLLPLMELPIVVAIQAESIVIQMQDFWLSSS